MRRRFAGEGIGSATSVPADTLAAATEALKAAQAGLKGRRGSRLGQGTQEERQEATVSKAAGSESAVTTAAAVPTGAVSSGTQDVSSLRKALGIDDLLTSLRGAGTREAAEMPQFEMPEFEMPEFEMPQFEMPDFAGMFADAFAKYAPQQNDETANASQTTAATVKTPKTNRVSVGSKSYDLAKTGGMGLGSQDIRTLKKKGWSASEIKKVAKQAPSVSAGAQRLLNAAKKPSGDSRQSPKKAQATAKKLTSTARAAIAKTAPKPARKAAPTVVRKAPVRSSGKKK